jgi:hypothetical protein
MVLNIYWILRRFTRFENTPRPQISDNKWNRAQGDADANRGKNFVDSIGHDKGAGSCRDRIFTHMITNHGDLLHQGGNINTTGYNKVEKSQGCQGYCDVKDDHCCPILSDSSLELLGLGQDHVLASSIVHWI